MVQPPTIAPAIGASSRRTAWQVQRAVLFAMLLREMKARVGGQWVGAVWTLFEPLSHVLIVVTLFAYVRGRVMVGIEFPVFLVTGMLPYFLYQNLSQRLPEAIAANKGLFSYRQVKPMDALLSRAGVEGLMNLLVYIFTLGLLGRIGYEVMPSDLLEVIAVNALLLLLGLSMGILYAVITHERPRLRSFVRMTSMPLYLASGIIFPIDRVDREHMAFLLWNPLLHLIELSRHAFIPAYVPAHGVNATYPILFTLSALALALLLYRKDRLRLVTIS